jgi:hypothetical protein
MDWALLEGKPGKLSAKRVFDLGAFIEVGNKPVCILLLGLVYTSVCTFTSQSSCRA